MNTHQIFSSLIKINFKLGFTDDLQIDLSHNNFLLRKKCLSYHHVLSLQYFMINRSIVYIKRPESKLSNHPTINIIIVT